LKLSFSTEGRNEGGQSSKVKSGLADCPGGEESSRYR
jgi:hypothetical protein